MPIANRPRRLKNISDPLQQVLPKPWRLERLLPLPRPASSARCGTVSSTHDSETLTAVYPAVFINCIRRSTKIDKDELYYNYVYYEDVDEDEDVSKSTRK